MHDEIIRYHADRAIAELDMALAARNAEAARAHFHLSSLHLERSQKLVDVQPSFAGQLV
jgi:hypothetical protein